jgi:hypothetical protein
MMTTRTVMATIIMATNITTVELPSWDTSKSRSPTKVILKKRQRATIISITIIVEISHMAIMDIQITDTTTRMDIKTMGISTRMGMVTRMGMTPILSPVGIMLAGIPTLTTTIRLLRSWTLSTIIRHRILTRTLLLDTIRRTRSSNLSTSLPGTDMNGWKRCSLSASTLLVVSGTLGVIPNLASLVTIMLITPINRLVALPLSDPSPAPVRARAAAKRVSSKDRPLTSTKWPGR